MEHNAYDIVSMAALLGDLTLRYERDPSVFCASDALCLARTAQRSGDHDSAIALAESVIDSDPELGGVITFPIALVIELTAKTPRPPRVD
jgi:hypothetical protein